MNPDTDTIQDMTEEVIPQHRRSRWWYVVAALLVATLTVFIGAYIALYTPVASFVPTTVEITPGSTIADITFNLKAAGVIRSDTALYIVLLMRHKDEPIQAGTYSFTEPLSTIRMADHLTSTSPDDTLLKLTLPEGMTIAAYAKIAAAILEGVTETEFIEHPLAIEGYLHPETYLVPDFYTTDDLVSLLHEETALLLEELTAAVDESSFSEREILTLASILEREANSKESMERVSGILQNRLNSGMALQADATIEYVLDTPLGALPPGALAQQLRELDSPYNSYLYQGLPPTPIGNPGRVAIEAVLYPTASNDFFYITDDEGVFHYAETFAQHQRNIAMYLR